MGHIGAYGDGIGFRGYMSPIVENHMEQMMKHEMVPITHSCELQEVQSHALKEVRLA